MAKRIQKRRQRIGRPLINPGHPFAVWISESGFTREKVAERLGVSRATVDRLARGQYPPSLALAQKIEKLTNRVVPCTTWCSEEKAV